MTTHPEYLLGIRVHPQERKSGDYWFSGQFYVTRGIKAELNDAQIHAIYSHVKALVEEKQGVDYLFQFERVNDGLKMFFIDQLTKAQIEGGEFALEHNTCTLMLASEY